MEAGSCPIMRQILCCLAIRKRALVVWVAVVGATFFASRGACDQVQYVYDSMGRLTEARSTAGSNFVYRHDLAGNRLILQKGDPTTDVDDRDGESLADLNRDGSVTLADLAGLRGAYGTERGSSCFVAAADLDRSGIVDLVDLLLWYRGYAQGSWRPGDWTSGAVTFDVAWNELAPDGRVDFFDLAALAKEWGPLADARSAARWLDLAPGSPDGRIDASDLAVFRGNWLAEGDFAPAASPTAGCVPAGQESALAISDAVLELSSREGAQADARPVVVEIVLNGPVSDIVCFQLLLESEIDLGLGEDETAAGLVLLGGEGEQQTACFLDVRPSGIGHLITGAFLDLAPIATPGARVLCSVAAPRLEEECMFTVRQARCSVSSGAVYQLSDWAGKVSLNPVPAVVTLLQNRPNPFNPVTTLKYAVPEAAPVRLRVYDLAGRLVATLVNEVRDRGWYESRWDGRTGDGRAAGSGVYFYRLQVGGETITRKMSLVR